MQDGREHAADHRIPRERGNEKGKRTADIDWELWLGPAPWEPYNPGRCDGNFGTGGNSWRSYTDYSGGNLTDWGAHHFGGAIFAADLRELQPVKVTFHPVTPG